MKMKPVSDGLATVLFMDSREQDYSQKGKPAPSIRRNKVTTTHPLNIQVEFSPRPGYFISWNPE